MLFICDMTLGGQCWDAVELVKKRVGKWKARIRYDIELKERKALEYSCYGLQYNIISVSGPPPLVQIPLGFLVNRSMAKNHNGHAFHFPDLFFIF